MSRHPIDYPLPENEPLEDGAVFVVLPTLDALEQFWIDNRHRYAYAVEGIAMTHGQSYLNEYEWIFAPSKAAVVKAVMRWDRIGIGCEWDDYTKSTEWNVRAWLADIAEERKKEIRAGSWSDDKQRDYEARRRGSWVLVNLPQGIEWYEWFSGFEDAETEINDPDLPVEVVVQRLQEATFDDRKESDPDELHFHDAASIDETIAYWRAEQKDGRGYYGIDGGE